MTSAGLWMIMLLAQVAAPPQAPAPPSLAELEQRELAEIVQNANNSAVDLIPLLEGFLQRHPNAVQRRDVEIALARAAIDSKDDRRTVLYGERSLANSPDDLLLLDRVARSLLNLGGKENAAASLTFSTAFVDRVMKAPPVEGREASRKQDERERALARALLFQSRAKSVLGEKEAAEVLASKSFGIYPAEDSARTWAEALDDAGRANDAIARWADAFALSDLRSNDSNRAELRRILGDRYKKLHGSEQGLGDALLAAFDRTATIVTARVARLQQLDPNSAQNDPMKFTVTGLDGSKLTLASLKGSVVVLDFWATWCTPCRAQHPIYELVKDRFKDRKDVVFLAIDADEDRTLVAPFLKDQNWSTARVYFEDGLQKLLQVVSIPTTVVIDKQGRIVSRMTGFLPEKFADQLSERITSVLNN